MRYNSLACYNPDQKVLRHFPFFMCLCMKFTANRQCTPINTALPRFLPQRRGGLTWIAFSLDERQSVPDVLTRIVVMNLKCTVAHSCHIKYKLLTSNTKSWHQKQAVSGRRTKIFSIFPAALTRPPFCSCTWYCRRDVLQQLRKKCRQLQLL